VRANDPSIAGSLVALGGESDPAAGLDRRTGRRGEAGRDPAAMQEVKRNGCSEDQDESRVPVSRLHRIRRVMSRICFRNRWAVPARGAEGLEHP